MNKQIKLAIIGLGYVGLPLALEFGKKKNVQNKKMKKVFGKNSTICIFIFLNICDETC